MIRTDAAFVIGKTHTVCEDYAVAAGEEGGTVSVWLSDGCSSSAHTDIGARLLTRRMQHRSKEWGTNPVGADMDRLLRQNAQAAIRLAKTLRLDATCADATLLGLIAPRESESVYAVLCGDGALVCGRDDGTRTVYHIKYAANYPFYPAYLTDSGRLATWRQVKNNACTLTTIVLNADGAEQSTRVAEPQEKVGVLSIPRDGLLWAAVVSDGVESVQRPGERPGSLVPVPYQEVIEELTAFKNFAGEFVQRRLQRWEKEITRRGWQHKDDLAIAALYFGEEGAH